MQEQSDFSFLLKTPSAKKWQDIGLVKRSGILAPIFSIYSRQSQAVGDLRDLKKLIDWAKLSGNSIVQLLPMNETDGFFCPYDSLSSFAIEPFYISLENLTSDPRINKEIDNFKDSYSLGEKYVDYSAKAKKIDLLRKIFSIQYKKGLKDLDNFRNENKYWLQDFCLYKVVKNFYQEKPWYQWPKEFRERKQEAIQKFIEEHEKEVLFQEWLQWVAFSQFNEAKKYAEKNQVYLKGDLPILVSRDSADVWAHQGFFKLDFCAGAPPDMYCAKGQRWGMPTYNWNNIISDDLHYIKEKLKYAYNFYHILRLDHVVGLFRIWTIACDEPEENKGLKGFFDPIDENAWKAHGKKLLSEMLNSSHMLFCAEDLGVIPDVCRQTLFELGIPGNDVQRWVKDWSGTRDFIAPEFYRQLSVVMLSTHDTANWPAWWENEAGTVDEGLFVRRCNDHRQIEFDKIKNKVFDLRRSKYSRLRWKDDLDSVEKLITAMGRRKEEIGDFIEMYQNTFREKEKLWVKLGLEGRMREKSDPQIVRKALMVTLNSASIFCINTIFDWLYLGGLIPGDPHDYRINYPGSIKRENWSLRLPVSLDELLPHQLSNEIRQMISQAERI